MTAPPAGRYDAVIIGAGVTGIYQLYRLLELGMDVTVLEAGSGPGGTWFWNRYPGARFDSESYTYGYSFSDELLDEWAWSEHFASQPETLEYLNYVVEKFGLRSHMQFGCVVERATFDEHASTWTVELDGGRTLSCRFLLTAVGVLSVPTMPAIPGLESFEGQAFHTFHWPSPPIDLAGKKVAVVGTGATGVQVISEIADKVGELTVFQRRPNWCAPLHNRPITDEEQQRIKSSYAEIFQRCAETPGGFIHGPDRRRFSEVSGEKRLDFWEKLYAAPGFGIWLGNFLEILVDESANAEFSAFVADKIRARVRDAAVAEKLIPTDHGFGTRRLPLETRYFEAYNRDNVHLVDLQETPIERVTPTGIDTTDRSVAFDIIVYATGFDAVTGALDRIEFIGVGGQTLRDRWAHGPKTFLGIQTAGFPNLFTLAGPTSASASTNFTRGIEATIDWVTQLIAHVRERGITRVEATVEAEVEWAQHVREMFDMTLIGNDASWITGHNSNIAGHDTTRYLVYLGGMPRFRARLRDIAEAGYPGFAFGSISERRRVPWRLGCSVISPPRMSSAE